MNYLGDGLVLNNNNSGQIEKDFKVSQENSTLDIKVQNDNSFIHGINEKKLNVLKDNLSDQGCDIISYFHSTHKFLLKSEDLSIFSFHKGSRNFIRKNKANSFYRNEFNKIIMVII